MDIQQALFALLELQDHYGVTDLSNAYLEKYGIDCAAYRNLLHLQGEINALVKEVESYREGY